MALGPRLDLRQSQSLVMTPQLQQAIKLLALSNLELEAYLAEALEGNPLLDAAPADREGEGEGEGEVSEAELTLAANAILQNEATPSSRHVTRRRQFDTEHST